MECTKKRKELGYNQTEMAKKMGISRQLLSDVERGVNVKYSSIELVYGYFGLDPCLYYVELAASRASDKDVFDIAFMQLKLALKKKSGK